MKGLVMLAVLFIGALVVTALVSGILDEQRAIHGIDAGYDPASDTRWPADRNTPRGSITDAPKERSLPVGRNSET